MQPPPPPPPPGAAGGAAGPPRPYASWGVRVLAYLLDGLVVAIPAGIVLVIGFVLIASSDEDGGMAALGLFVTLIGYVLALVINLWNQGWRQGVGGQSLGKQALDIEVVHEDTGAPLGGGQGVLRWLLMVILGGACLLDYLWPLWDDKSQTWHDMIVDSIVVESS